MDLEFLLSKAKAKQLESMRQRLACKGPIRLACVGNTHGAAREAFGWMEKGVVGLIGIAFSGIGIDSFVKFLNNKFSSDEVAMPFFGIIGLLMLVGDYYMIAYRNELTLDATARTWMREIGLWPRRRTWSGNWDQILGLQTKEVTVTYHRRPRQLWRTSIQWKDSSIPHLTVTLLERESQIYSKEEVEAHVREFAQKLGLSIIS